MNHRKHTAELAIIDAELTAARATVTAYAALYTTGPGAPSDEVDAADISDRWNGAHDRVRALEAIRWDVERAPGLIRYRRDVPEATRALIAANID